MALASGTKLGPYEIQSPLGAGGMGEVYRAKDTRLGRDVAIKVLPEALVKDADRLRRFEQEARTIAALESSAKIHPADVPARLSLQRAICERPADSGVQRTVGKQSTVDLHRAHGI